MKAKIFSIFILLLFLCPAFSAEKTRIAVLELKSEGVPQRTARTVSNMLRTSLINTGKFLVIERSQMDAIFKEQGLQQTGCTDQSCAVQLGRLMSANKILVGEVSMLGTAIITTIRIVDVEKGFSEYAAQEKADTEANLDTAVSVLTKKLVASIENVAYVAVSTAPGPPSSISASDAQFSDKIQISWISSEGARKYFIYRSETPDGGFSEIGDASGTLYEDKDADPGKFYYYKLKAKNDIGMSEFSATDKGNINVIAPNVVTASTDNTDYVKIAWNSVDGADRYYVYRSDSTSGSYTEIGSTASTSYKDIGAVPGKSYWYKIKVTSPTNTTELGEATSGVREIYVITQAGYYTRGIVPGWGQFYAKKPVMGGIILGTFVAAAAFTVWTTLEFNKAKKDYDDLPLGASKSEFDSKYDDYESSAALCNYARIALAAVYVINWAELLLNRPVFGPVLTVNDSQLPMFSINIESNDRYGINDKLFTVSTGIRF